ncbi:AAA family ATPase [uncultured Fibrobacter sp.]|uniref:AAA family ATPase n=1 Tax=uncultured Fibrobacter sp. TaxID=261512 RepID=UPI0028053D24|nr:AAA family ATPase [uncultured Fibrobacter sp.]
MRLDQGSLIFNPQNGECPSWETALGQSREPRDNLPPYYFKADGYENILKGMFFNAVPLAKTSCILGKKKNFVTASDSYKNPEYQEIQMASKFDIVVVHEQNNERTFRNAPIILLLTKIQDVNKSHFRRRSIKYSPHTTYENVKNQTSFDEIQRHFEHRLMCYGIFVEHFDTLHLYCTNVDINSNYANLSLPTTEWTDWVDWEQKEREKIKNIESATTHQKDDSKNESTTLPDFTPTQIIYYGVPGCGKSNKIKELLQNVPEKNKIRVVFHPEYTNADFVGQILPVVNGGIHYEFTPGPFTQILKRAYLESNKEFYLVIEEINRGNAAAIFGDIFQLLDRLKPGKTDSLGNDPNSDNVNEFTQGWSQYYVQNDDINDYIRNVVEDGNGGYKEPDDLSMKERHDIKIGKIIFTNRTAIRLPPNLSIYATMNTSDQNVFTLDNAFQRRFDMELVRNEFEKGEDAAQFGGFKTEDIRKQHDAQIADTSVKWGKFWEWINRKIVAILKGLSSTEDKRLGVWFVSNANGKIDEKVFAEKVLKYLWDDVFKFKRSQVFAEGIDTLEKLIQDFETSKGNARFNVFKDADELISSTVSQPMDDATTNG